MSGEDIVDEIIVVDDSSDDRTVERASRLYRVFVHVHPRNRGYGFSVNRGIVESAGDRILLLNDDARPFPDMLRECDRLLAADPAIGVVGQSRRSAAATSSALGPAFRSLSLATALS